MGKMHSNSLIIAQSRSGGTVVCKLMQKYYRIPYLGEYFNKSIECFDLQERIDVFKSPAIVKASYNDLKDCFDNVMDLRFDNIYHMYRSDPVGMVCSSFLSSITGVYHIYTKTETHIPVTDAVMDKEFVEWFFAKENLGGWYYNNPKNIPFLKDVNYIPLVYNDSSTQESLLEQVIHKKVNIDTSLKKLYKDKSKAIKNLDQVKEWVNHYV